LEEIHVNLEQLRKQAKELVRSARDGDAGALARLGDLPVKLSSAQLVLAREQGYPSWPALVHAVEATVESFLAAATSGRCGRAQRLLDARPEIGSDPWARIALGRGFDDRLDVNAPGGPLGWAPLLYVTHSCFASVELARELLERGADPNVTFRNEFGDMSAVYGAAGVVHSPELTQLLLEAGADPNDGESVYHSCEASDPACLLSLLKHGADPNGTAGLAHAIDYDHIEHVKLMLVAGADPAEAPLLVHAVRRGCGEKMIRLLADAGAPLNMLGGEWSTPESEYRTAYQNAVLRGNDEIAELLAELGASTEVWPEDRLVATLARGDLPAYALPENLGPDAQEVLILAVLRRDYRETIIDVIGADFFGHVGGGPPGQLIHHASWVGKPEVVSLLLERGADPAAKSGAEFDTPLAWTFLASRFHELPNRDFVGVAELLVANGAELEERFADVAEGRLADWLEERL
jgi:ankyrin repeat protein